MAILGFRRTHLNRLPFKPLLKSIAGLVPIRYLAGITGREIFRVHMGDSSFLYEFSGNDSIGELLFWHGAAVWEPEAHSVFRRHLAGARTVLDIGANTGVYSLLALSANPSCRVVAWEPFPANYEKLARNVALNGLAGRAELRREAACESNVTSFLEPNENWTMHAISSAPSGSAIPVLSTTVDSVIPEGLPVDLVKMDVEGREYEALSGATRMLAESQPAILIEIQPDCPTRSQTIALLEGLGYSITPVDTRANFLALPDRRRTA